MTIIQQQVCKDIQAHLETTKKHCAAKLAYDPKGWLRVNIKKCSEDIVTVLCKKYYFVKK